ncbi:hypothetical protein ACN28I_33815 [Archangium gephyra]|uniref:hypothetical protein n=1 Tax=Archangium gephyra TaxID=48 RepID=UPI003B7C528C
MTNPLASPSRLPLLLLLLLAPGVGLAAQEPTLRLEPRLASSGLPGTDERAPLRLGEEDWAQGEKEEFRPPRGLRILAETGAGVLTGVGGGFLGFMAGGGLCGAGIVGNSSGFFGCLDSAAIGLILGAGAGVTLGVWWGGEAAGGDGKLLAALAGMGSGVVVGFLAGVVAGRPDLGLYFTLPGALIGAIVGYELSQRTLVPGPRSPAVASARPRLQPLLAFSPHGGLVGLGGSF